MMARDVLRDIGAHRDDALARCLGVAQSGRDQLTGETLTAELVVDLRVVEHALITDIDIGEHACVLAVDGEFVVVGVWHIADFSHGPTMPVLESPLIDTV